MSQQTIINNWSEVTHEYTLIDLAELSLTDAILAYCRFWDTFNNK